MLEIIVATEYLQNDPDGRSFLDYINANSVEMGLDEAIVYYGFPTYSDYEGNLSSSDALILSPKHGILPINFARNETFFSSTLEQENVIQKIDDFSTLLYSRLLKSKILKANVSSIKLNISPIIFAFGDNKKVAKVEDETIKVIQSYESFEKLLESLEGNNVPPKEFEEARSVIEGAKALTRSTKRIVESAQETYATELARLENEISNFDQKQRTTALSLIQGPQRIRGLAGSGKTVILAMKAAHIHLTHPEANILVTYYTKALKHTLQTLISKFYRHFKDEAPDWNKVHIKHGWGGQNLSGVYSDTCKRLNIMPLSFKDARAKALAKDPFAYICEELVKTNKVDPYYDYILIDEGQDFPKSFYELCFFLAYGGRDKKSIIWAYDELQNILNVKMPSAQDLFGIDKDEQPRIDLDRARQFIPKFSSNDIVLSKCYRNQRKVLLTAHALGLGLYSEQIVQLLQNEEHWADVGYNVKNPPLKVGKEAIIERPEENSPLNLDEAESGKTIKFHQADSIENEVKWISKEIKLFLDGGLKPEDIMVIALDDSNARSYLKELSEYLSEENIQSNNLIADPYSEPSFVIEGKVTLSTVYRAKGNEAAVVFACGIDAIKGKTRLGRNKLFAAFTRTKAWLRISGIGESSERYHEEINSALENFPNLKFVMPDLETINTIQRDLTDKAIKAKRARDKYLNELNAIGLNEDDISDLIG